MGYKLFESKIKFFNDKTVSTKEKIGYCMKWLYDAKQKLKSLKREKNHHEYNGPFLSDSAQAYIDLKKDEGEEVSPEEIQELKEYAGKEKLWFLEKNIAQQNTTIESLEAELQYWQNFKEIENSSSNESLPADTAAAIDIVAKRISSKRGVFSYDTIKRVMETYYLKRWTYIEIKKYTGCSFEPNNLTYWKQEVNKILDKEKAKN